MVTPGWLITCPLCPREVFFGGLEVVLRVLGEHLVEWHPDWLTAGGWRSLMVAIDRGDVPSSRTTRSFVKP